MDSERSTVLRASGKEGFFAALLSPWRSDPSSVHLPRSRALSSRRGGKHGDENGMDAPRCAARRIRGQCEAIKPNTISKAIKWMKEIERKGVRFPRPCFPFSSPVIATKDLIINDGFVFLTFSHFFSRFLSSERGQNRRSDFFPLIGSQRSEL